MPAVQNLHRNTVALSNPGDQNIVRSSLRGTHWPSHKVGRLETKEGSTGKGKIFLLTGLSRCICELDHIRRNFSKPEPRTDPADRSRDSDRVSFTLASRGTHNRI
jgi:hypothetical protein